MADPSALAVSSIAIGQTVTAYTAFLPRLSDVRRDGSADMRTDVYVGQIAAGGVSLLVGAIIGSLVGSRLPVIVSLIIAAFLAAVYHYAMLSGTEQSA
jgi:hypothetical protein